MFRWIYEEVIYIPLIMIACSHFYAFFCIEIIIQNHLIENEWTAKFFYYNMIWQICLSCLDAVKGPF